MVLFPPGEDPHIFMNIVIMKSVFKLNAAQRRLFVSKLNLNFLAHKLESFHSYDVDAPLMTDIIKIDFI